MITLFIDTHYKDILLYLFKDNELLDKRVLLNVKSTSVETMPTLIELLSVNNLKVNNINKIAVVKGPGSFTGTRIGVTIAKTLSYANKIPIVSMTSLDLIGLNLDSESYVGVLENNGAFVCLYNNKQIDDIKYYKLSEYNEFKNNHKVVDNIEIDNNKLINYINSLVGENPHNVNPLYVKNKLDYDRLGYKLNDNFSYLFDLESTINKPYNYIFGYFENNKLLGFIHIVLTVDEADLINIVVDDYNRHKKIGTKLIYYVIKRFNKIRKS